MTDMRQVGTLQGITLCPIKSCTGVSLDQGFCGFEGLATTDRLIKDRHIMIVTPDGKMVTPLQEGRVVLIKPTLHGNVIHLDAPGMQTLQLPITPPHDAINTILDCRMVDDHIEGVDYEIAAEWLKTFTGKEYRLVYSTSELRKRIVKYASDQHPQPAGLRNEDELAFQNRAPIHLAGTASLEDVNSKLSKKVHMDSFRPSLIIETKTPFEEDNWHTVQIGGASFKQTSKCDRCLLINFDPETGVRSPEEQPLKTLRTYRIFPEVSKYSPCFGIDMTISQPGIISVGDPVYAS